MMPSLDDQERIFVNKYVYRLEPIERGDIMVFRYPRDPSKSFIKRVIGLAGDRIRIESGEVFVNDTAREGVEEVGVLRHIAPEGCHRQRSVAQPLHEGMGEDPVGPVVVGLPELLCQRDTGRSAA